MSNNLQLRHLVLISGLALVLSTAGCQTTAPRATQFESPALTPAPAITPTVHVVAPRTTDSPIPVGSSAPATPPATSEGQITGPGSLLVEIPGACRDVYKFDIRTGETVVWQGSTGEKQAVPPGTYDISLHTRIGNYATREGVTVQAGNTALVDFSPELGVLELVSPPSLKQRFVYLAEPGNWDNGPLSSDVPQCGLPGRYAIHFATSLCDGPNGSCRSLALFGDDALPVLAVEVRAGETTRLSPDVWTRGLGLLSFVSKFDEMNLAAEISRSRGGKRADSGGFSLRTNTAYWALPGSYDVVLTDPYVNLAFRNVVVKAGEKTEVALPRKPTR